VPEDLVLSPEEAVREAQRLLDAGLPFQAHEVLEGAWKAAGPQERELWRGLAQVAVGLTHAQRGNGRGAVALLRRGSLRIAEWEAERTVPVPVGLDLAGLRRHADELVVRVERAAAEPGGELALSPADLRPRLRPAP
jgi:hypothetical protein